MSFRQRLFTATAATAAVMLTLAAVSAFAAAPTPPPAPATRPAVSLGVMPFPMEGRPPAEQVRVAAELGYTGITCWYAPAERASRIEAFQATPEVRDGRVKFVAVLWAPHVDQPYDRDALDAALKSLARTGTHLWLMLQGAPADEAAIVDRTREIADQAAGHGVAVVLYPHYRHAIETTEAALAVHRKVDRPNLKVSLHLCHELKAGNDARLGEIVQLARPHLDLVSISGADTRPKAARQMDDWKHEIRPLDEGDFDVRGLYLRPLLDAGYRGPILLHTFGLPEPAEPHLRRSQAWWRRTTATAAATPASQP